MFVSIYEFSLSSKQTNNAVEVPRKHNIGSTKPLQIYTNFNAPTQQFNELLLHFGAHPNPKEVQAGSFKTVVKVYNKYYPGVQQVCGEDTRDFFP